VPVRIITVVSTERSVFAPECVKKWLVCEFPGWRRQRIFAAQRRELVASRGEVGLAFWFVGTARVIAAAWASWTSGFFATMY
jgi:hypothetical protein